MNEVLKLKSKKAFKLLIILLAFALALSCMITYGAFAHGDSVVLNTHSTLNLAAQITKIGDEYFIEDGYNDQIIYSSSLDAPLNEWKVMASGINRGHSVAGNGKFYMVDDTDNHRFIAYLRNGDEFAELAIFGTGDGSRPHYVVYDEESKKFYGLVSMTGEIYVFSVGETVYKEKVMQLPELNGIYVRSFAVIDGEIYFISGNNNIIRTSKNDLSVIERIPVPNVMRSMANIMKAGDYFYITVSGESVAEQNQNAGLIRTKSLKGLISYDYENITHLFGTGIPYYLSAFDGKYYLAMQNTPGVANSHIYEFGIEEGDIAAVKMLF